MHLSTVHPKDNSKLFICLLIDYNTSYEIYLKRKKNLNLIDPLDPSIIYRKSKWNILNDATRMQ